MPNYDDSIRGRFMRQTEPYHFQRSLVQVGSNFPRPPQPGIQPNQLAKMSGQGFDMDSWFNMMRDYEKETGLPAFNRGEQLDKPRRFNWRVI